jgi:hypothetical protein
MEDEMRHETLIPVYVEHMPEELQEGVLYISEIFQTAIHLCACGECGRETVTPLSQGWTVTDDGGKITIRPSIGNWQMPCKSHYFITDGRVEWC